MLAIMPDLNLSNKIKPLSIDGGLIFLLAVYKKNDVSILNKHVDIL